jgi:hypothetical protein
MNNNDFYHKVFKTNSVLNKTQTVQPVTGPSKIDDKDIDTNKPPAVVNFNDKLQQLLDRNTYLENQFEILYEKYKSLSENLLSLDEKISSKFNIEPKDLSSSLDDNKS